MSDGDGEVCRSLVGHRLMWAGVIKDGFMDKIGFGLGKLFVVE